MDDKTTKTMKETLKGAGEAGRNIWMTWLEAGCEMSAQLDRLARAQIDHVMGASRASADFLAQATDAVLKAREEARKAGLELASTARWN